MMNTQKSSLYYLSTIYALFFFAIFSLNSQLVLFSNHLNLNSTNSYELIASFNALLFTLPLLGGYLVDKLNKILACHMALLVALIGFLLLALEKSIFLFWGVACVLVSNALFTPSFLYQVNVHNNNAGVDKGVTRDGNTMVFYIFMNLGAFLGALIGGYLSQRLGYGLSFKLSAAVLLICQLYYLFVIKVEIQEAQNLLKNKRLNQLIVSIGFCALALILTHGLLIHGSFNLIFLLMLMLIAIVYIGFLVFHQENQVARYRLMAFLILCLISIPFWSLYLLEPSLLTVFVSEYVNHHFFKIEIPSSSFLGFNPFFILLFGFMFNKLWGFLNKKGKNLSIPGKFFLSILLVGLGYLLLAWALKNSSFKSIHCLWLVAFYAVLACAELLLAPAGLFMSFTLSPKGKEARLFGIWQLFMGLSAMLSGYIASLSIPVSSMGYDFYKLRFTQIGVAAITVALLFSFFVPHIQKWIEKKQ